MARETEREAEARKKEPKSVGVPPSRGDSHGAKNAKMTGKGS